MQTIYIDLQGNKHGVLVNQDHLVKPDWIKCQKLKDGTYANDYNLDGTIDPSNDEIQAQRRAAYDTAVVVFESLPIGKQALWQPVRAAVADAILSGDMEKAKEILVTVPALYADAVF